MKKVIYGILIFIVVVTTGILIVKLNIIDESEPVKEECYSISGGGYNIIFNTNNDVIVSSMHVCIACPPDVYADLPVPSKAGYEFLGWYYNPELTKKVEVTNSLDITPNPIYKQENCITGYNDITLYAKWNKIDKQ